MSDSISINSSPLFFGPLTETNFGGILKEKFPYSKFVILTDENVAEHWVEYLTTEFDSLHGCEIIQLPPGEENKNIEICVSVWEALSEYEISRNDVIINLGGGVMTDMGGFIASTFKRGLRFINIPTTLLAQVDASLGGKTGIDLGAFKNQVGVFSEAEFVFIDSQFLSTLPKEQLYSGFAEMLKHGLIADIDYWKKLLTISPESIAELIPFIKQSVEIKKKIVEQDYHEKNIRKTLNFGHTIGHAIEGFYLSKYQPMLHGYAVAYGMIAESYLSYKMNLISENDFHKIKVSLQQRYGNLDLKKESFGEILALLNNDKKNSNGEINFTLLSGIGSSVFDQKFAEELIVEALEILIG